MAFLYCAMLGAMAMASTGNLLTNADFEQGSRGWSFSHSWYSKPAGSGLSTLEVVGGEGRGGSQGLRLVGQGKRGIAMQVRSAYPGRYQVTGWIKCEKLTGAQASILCEWIGRDNKWLRGDTAGSLTGTHDWQHFETTVTAPPETRSVHLDLLTSEPTSGTAWFDDIHFERLPSGLPPPQAPRLTVHSPHGEEESLLVRWDRETLPAGSVRVLVYCSAQPLAGQPTPVPAAVMDSDAGRGMVRSLAGGRTYHVAARLVNADEQCSPLGPETTALVRDRQAPRAGWIAAERTPTGTRVEWSPDVLDRDVARIHFCLPGADDAPGATLRTVEVAPLYREPRPFYCTQPWVSEDLPFAATVDTVGVWCEDSAGNRGRVGWAEVTLPRPATALASGALWTAPPTDNIARSAVCPQGASQSFALRLMRGQAKGFQVVVRPARDLRRVRVTFEALRHVDGASRLDTRWLAYHFVNYARLDKNSVATPREELVWPGPGDYPDELNDDLTRDLPGEITQPIYIRVTAPRDARPGKYEGQGYIESEQGRSEFRFTVRVEPVALPDPVRMPFVYWFSWDAPCKQFGVDRSSADGWRVLYRLGQLMRAHHQRVVVVPWDLVRSWRGTDDALVHDFSDFDRYVRTFQSAGVDQLFCLSHIGARSTGQWECPTMASHTHYVRSLTTGDALPRLDAVELLPALQAHIEKLGLVDRFCVHVADEPTPVNVASYRQLAARVKQAAPRLRRIDAIHVPDLAGALEIWVPQVNYFAKWRGEYRTAQAAGNEVWFYVAWVPQGKFPNRMIDSHAIKPRVLHWLNALDDSQGYLHWALNHWSIPLSSLDSPGDQYICWPAHRAVANSSLRYEAEREGLEDCELMFMVRDALMQRGRTRAQAQQQMEAVGRKAVRGVEDYTRSWSELEAVRGELIEQLTGR